MTKTDVKVKLIGQDGNIFNLVGIASQALTRAGYRKESDELCEKLSSMRSYDEALQLIMKYVEVS